MTKQSTEDVSAAAVTSATPAVKTSAGDSTAEASSTATGAPAAAALDTRHAALRYTTMRLALFLCALVLVWGVALLFRMDLSSQLSKLSLLAVALLLSSAVSFVVLSRQRDAMSAGLIARTERLGKKFGEAAAFEDEDEEDE